MDRIRRRPSNWKAIIGFVLPWYSSTEVVSKCQTTPLIQAKLDEISGKHNKPWEVFMEEELTKACAKLQAADVSEDIGEENNKDVGADIDMTLEGQDPSEDPATMGNKEAV